MSARVVIGANFGDEGKGLLVDYLCATEGAGMVVRFNGGAQAGHTVVTPEGKRHVFSHVGAGAFCNVPTFLSQFFVCNPLLFFKELDRLDALGVYPQVYAHPNCLVTTFADMLINQKLEDERGAFRHGSCGIGVNETILRSDVAELKITMSDIWNGASTIKDRLAQICGKYATFRTGSPIENPDDMIEAFVPGLWKFAETVHPLGIDQCKDPIFEGAQGLLLDQDNKEFFPHLTRSNTGMKNVRALLNQANARAGVEIYYVSRSYLTRHGAGPLPGEDRKMKFEDTTNVEHSYQGVLRFAPLDVASLEARCYADAKKPNVRLLITHCDQLEHPGKRFGRAYGPTRDDVVLP